LKDFRKTQAFWIFSSFPRIKKREIIVFPRRKIEIIVFSRYFLNPRDNLRERFSSQGSVRLNIRYSAESIISPQHYKPLRKLLLLLPEDDSLITSSAAFILGEICEDKMDVAKPLVRVFLKYGQLLPLIRALGHLEMNTITWVSSSEISNFSLNS
jgi:hypothetical protein